MSEWTVNPQTLLFENLSNSQAEDLENLAFDGQIYGKTYFEHGASVEWFKIAGFNNDQQLLTYSTVFLARAALSSSLYFRNFI